MIKRHNTGLSCSVIAFIAFGLKTLKGSEFCLTVKASLGESAITVNNTRLLISDLTNTQCTGSTQCDLDGKICGVPL